MTDHEHRRVRRHRITLQLTLLGGCDVLVSSWWAKPYKKTSLRQSRRSFSSVELGEKAAIALANKRLKEGCRLLKADGIDMGLLEIDDD